MNRKNVNSSNIKSIGYDADTRTLEIEFQSGDVWQYEDVTAPEYNGLLSAASVGSYFHKFIKQGHTGKRVPKEESEKTDA